MVTDAQGNEKKALVGHLGTHFDVMNKEFPLEYTRRNAIVFDVSKVQDRGVFVIENLCNLKELCGHGNSFVANTYPMNYAEMSGLPCRVVAELAESTGSQT